MSSRKTVMRLVDSSTGLMECPVCGHRHLANIRPDSGGCYYRGSWQCPNGCTKDMIKAAPAGPEA